MKKPYLANYANKIKINNETGVYYDKASQITYKDQDKKIKIVDIGKFESTIETRVIENSDPDEFNLYGTTKSTFTVEDNDPDEFFQLGSTRLTETIEDSDPDELYRLGSTVETATIENSDPDEFYLC